MHQWRAPALLAILSSLIFARIGDACVGSECLQIWSTADGGGSLTVQFIERKILAGPTFCAAGTCFYSTIDPGFMAPPEDTAPGDSYFRLVDGTEVSVEIVAIDPALRVGSVNGHELSQAGDAAVLGTMPTIHVHPSWQIIVPTDVFGDYLLSYRLTTTSPLYASSDVYTVTVSNLVAVGPTPTPTETPASDCPGDCDPDEVVTDTEIEMCVDIGLGELEPSACVACDVNRDGEVTVDELVAGVLAKLEQCPAAVPVTLAEIQSTIFTPKCAIATCHDAQTGIESLVLADGASHANLVGVASIETSMPRVTAGDPSMSFLYVKVAGQPPLGQGSRMPLTGGPLSTLEIEKIRSWILGGALP